LEEKTDMVLGFILHGFNKNYFLNFVKLAFKLLYPLMQTSFKLKSFVFGLHFKRILKLKREIEFSKPKKFLMSYGYNYRAYLVAQLLACVKSFYSGGTVSLIVNI
jgi:hypothetical protein